jgi:hypothetical protein
MAPDPIIGRILLVDGLMRPVFADDGGHQYVIDHDSNTGCYGVWLPERGSVEADAPLVVTGRRSR